MWIPTYAERQAALHMTPDEHRARAALMGMEYMPVEGGVGVYRERLGSGSYHGVALFCYRNAASLKPVKGLEARSETDSRISSDFGGLSKTVLRTYNKARLKRK